MAESDKKVKAIRVRLSEGEEAKAKKVARARGMTPSQLFRWYLNNDKGIDENGKKTKRGKK